MKTAYLQWITLPVSISSYCFVCTQANSGSVYYNSLLTYSSLIFKSKPRTYERYLVGGRGVSELKNLGPLPFGLHPEMAGRNALILTIIVK